MAGTGSVNITPEDLNKSYRTYRKELIMQPVFALSEALQYMTLWLGVRFQETVGELMGDMEIGNYDPFALDDDDVSIIGRTLEVRHGNCVKQFNPNSVLKSIYGSSILHGDGLKNVPITKVVFAYLMKKLGQSLYRNLWTAKHVDGSRKTAEYFDGFETIIDKEIADGNISVANKNLVEIPAITAENAEDVFKSFYRQASPLLTQDKTRLFCTFDEYYAYCDAYQLNHGSLPYNNRYDKPILEGSLGKCEITPLHNVSAGKLKLTTKSNLIVGMNLSGEYSDFVVAKSLKSHYMLDLICDMIFGCQIKSLSPEFGCYAKVTE